MSGSKAAGELARAFARCFSGAEGARVMAHLRALTLDRALGPEADSAALRHLEGQRALVRHMQTLVERGRQGDRPVDPFNNSETDHAEQTIG